MGIKDSAKTFYDDTLKSARDLARPDLIKVLTFQSSSAIEWLQDSFHLGLDQVARLGGHSYERTHRSNTEKFPGMEITYALMEKMEELAEKVPDRVKIIKKARVTQLLRENEKVVGVEYEYKGDKYKDFGPVVLATGGYAADFGDTSLLKKHRPEIFDLSTTNGAHCTGDGHKMVMSIGGKAIDMDKVQVHPTGLVDPSEPNAKVKFLAAEALRGSGGILLDGNGDRFCDELGHRDYVTGMMWKSKLPIRLILNGKSSESIAWHCKHYTGRRLMKKLTSGAQLAKEIGCSEEHLAASFKDYSDIAAGEKKDPYGKKFFHNAPYSMDDKVFYVALMEPVLHYTMGGVEIDDKSQIISESGNPIEGLYACGELAGGVHGANRLGGSSLLGCVVFGRVAGDSASSYLLKQLTTGAASSANDRLQQVSSHLVNFTIDPSSKNITISFDDKSVQTQQQQQANGQIATASVANSNVAALDHSSARGQDMGTVEKLPQKVKIPNKQYTMDDVKNHNKKEDIWVAVNGEVIDVTNFLEDHPGGAKALLLYAGRECSEQFNVIHSIPYSV